MKPCSKCRPRFHQIPDLLTSSTNAIVRASSKLPCIVEACSAQSIDKGLMAFALSVLELKLAFLSSSAGMYQVYPHHLVASGRLAGMASTSALPSYQQPDQPSWLCCQWNAHCGISSAASSIGEEEALLEEWC